MTAEARKRWARRMMARAGGPSPAYGTPEWLALPEGDLHKVAAVVRAAECWATEGDELEERLRREVEALRAAYKHDDDLDYAGRRDAHRAEWSGLPGQVVGIQRAKGARRQMLEGGEAS
jgi:hypothetical protein